VSAAAAALRNDFLARDALHWGVNLYAWASTTSATCVFGATGGAASSRETICNCSTSRGRRSSQRWNAVAMAKPRRAWPTA
jgi:hypothetical protein